jgi:hypothetical protein
LDAEADRKERQNLAKERMRLIMAKREKVDIKDVIETFVEKENFNETKDKKTKRDMGKKEVDEKKSWQVISYNIIILFYL